VRKATSWQAKNKYFVFFVTYPQYYTSKDIIVLALVLWIYSDEIRNLGFIIVILSRDIN
jgi:hypothetical protein